jgi:hypothetical protein
MTNWSNPQEAAQEGWEQGYDRGFWDGIAIAGLAAVVVTTVAIAIRKVAR